MSNSNPHKDPALRERYRRAFPNCEVWRWVARAFPQEVISAEFKLYFHGVIPKDTDWIDATEVHHIFGGHGGRYDVWSNLIATHPGSHRMAHRFPREFRLICLWSKYRKSQSVSPAEFDCAELALVSGKSFPSYLSTLDDCGNPVLRSWRDEMTSHFGERNVA